MMLQWPLVSVPKGKVTMTACVPYFTEYNANFHVVYCYWYKEVLLKCSLTFNPSLCRCCHGRESIV